MALPVWHKGFELGVCEFTSASIKTTSARAAKAGSTVKTLRFSLFRLCVAVAKSVLTRDPTSENLVGEVWAALHTIGGTVDISQKDLRLVSGFRKKYRDFSRTGRMGELAQGISFIFAQESLRHPIVLDFAGFLASQGIPPVTPEVKLRISRCCSKGHPTTGRACSSPKALAPRNPPKQSSPR
jgi:hypothetical protein